MSREKTGLPPRAAERPNARPCRSAEPASGSGVDIDAILNAARCNGATHVVFFEPINWVTSGNAHSFCYGVQHRMGRDNDGRTARQRRSAKRNTAALYEQRRARREQHENSATAEVETNTQTETATAAATTTTGDGGSPTAATNGPVGRPARPPGLETGAAPMPRRGASATAQGGSVPEPGAEPERALESEDEATDEAIAAAMAAAEAAAAAEATETAIAAADVAGAIGSPAVMMAGEAASAVDVGAAAVDERRAAPTGKRKRQAVLATRVGIACIDVGEEADVGAPSRVDVSAPSRARAGVQCEGRCAGGRRCGVRSVGSSAPSWVSAPLRSGGRHCVTHDPRLVAARQAKAAAKAEARSSGGRGTARRAGVQPRAATGVQRAGAARRAAAASGSTAGMAATIMAARGK